MNQQEGYRKKVKTREARIAIKEKTGFRLQPAA
jgi:hypothetical protein